jgi:membrane protein
MTAKVPTSKIIIRAIASFMENDLTTSAAAVSYFSMLVLFPTLLFLLTIGSRLFGEAPVEKYVISQVIALLPGAQAFVRRNLESISGISVGVIISCFLVTLWAASWLFTVIEKALNRIWGTYPRSFLHGRAVNFLVMTIAWGLLATSAVAATFVTTMRAEANKLHIPMAPWLVTVSGFAWQAMFMVGSLILTITLFTILYKMLPNTAVPIYEALTGAVIAGVLWEAAKFGFAHLLPYFHYDLLYGSIGAAVALLTWVYLSSIIMLFGAQFTALLHRDHLLNPAERHSESASQSRVKGVRLTSPRQSD